MTGSSDIEGKAVMGSGENGAVGRERHRWANRKVDIGGSTLVKAWAANEFQVFTSSTGLTMIPFRIISPVTIHELSNLLATPESREPNRGNERDGRSSL